MTGRALYWNCPHCGAEFTGTETEDAHTLKLTKGKDVFTCSTCGNLCCSNCKVVCEECLEVHGPGCEHNHCNWCKQDPKVSALRHEGPHATTCLMYRRSENYLLQSAAAARMMSKCTCTKGDGAMRDELLAIDPNCPVHTGYIHTPSGGDCPDMGPEPEYNNRNFPYEGHVKDE